MAGATVEQQAWVLRALGVGAGDAGEAVALDLDDDDEVEAEEFEDVSSAPARPPLAVPARPLLPIWIEAKEDLDADIDRLQQALRADGDEGLLTIAEYGLHKVTEGNSVQLMAALREADGARSEAAVAKAYDAVEQFRGFLAASPGIDVIEDNPVEVAVPVRRKLGRALDQLAGAMEG